MTTHEHTFLKSSTIHGEAIEACACGARPRRDLPSRWQVMFFHRDGSLMSKPDALAKAISERLQPA